ncbi:MAG: cob(I)yrinic acid a,c-diamide adenosyltransferase [Rikenellaceae bacterium]
MSVYTKTGDDGTTALIGGRRVPKHDLQLEAYGTVDELTAFVALLHDSIAERNIESDMLNTENKRLLTILNKLMVVQSLFAADEGVEKKLPQISEDDILELESSIDSMSDFLPKIFKFTLPCGDSLVSKAHVCRTICRRAERAGLRAAETVFIEPLSLKYLNRLSDYLYTLSRLLSCESKCEEILWEP